MKYMSRLDKCKRVKLQLALYNCLLVHLCFIAYQGFFTKRIIRIHFCTQLNCFKYYYVTLINLSINFIADFCPHLCSSCFFTTFRPNFTSGRLCCFSHYVSAKFSPLVVFRWLTTTSDRNSESCNRIPSNYFLP